MLTTADIFADLADVLKTEAEKKKANTVKQMKFSSASEVVLQQIGEREKVSMLEDWPQ